MINPELFTDKTTKTLSDAQTLASDHHHVQLTPLHIAAALFNDDQGIGCQLCNKAGVDRQVIRRQVGKALVRLPQQDPAPDTIQPSSACLGVLRKADELRKKQSKHSTLIYFYNCYLLYLLICHFIFVFS
jgi:ATP-dependent Clp protease ATP-binding subunit ClpB